MFKRICQIGIFVYKITFGKKIGHIHSSTIVLEIDTGKKV